MEATCANGLGDHRGTSAEGIGDPEDAEHCSRILEHFCRTFMIDSLKSIKVMYFQTIMTLARDPKQFYINYLI